MFLGTSAAAALHAAVQVGRRPENQGKNIVVIVPDNGMKYLSTPMCRQK
jgi:cysteine synthase A